MTQDTALRTKSHHAIALIIVMLPGCFLFLPAILGGETVAFRDASRFYFPTIDWVWGEWAHGRVPLWNPQENLGVPLTAEISSGVFYPLQIMFLFPASLHVKYNFYILVHVWIAACSTYAVAVAWRMQPASACLSGLAYAYGAPMLFNYCNVIFLIGAAWLPLGILAVDWMLRKRSTSAATMLGVVAALMVLGGDPHTAYHLGLTAILGVCCYSTVRKWKARLAHGARLALAGVIAAALTAVVLLPGWEWGRDSDRMRSGPLPVLDREDTNGPLGGDPGHASVYPFSIGPWRLIELAWPNVLGRMFPVHQRWGSSIPAEGRVWSPSLYLGLVPILLAPFAMRLRCGTVRRRWLTWFTIFAVVASFGMYGMGWLAKEFEFGLTGQSRRTGSIASPLGGLYWALVEFAPGYAAFRYPAKWFVVAGFGIAMLAGWRLDKLAGIRRPSERRWCLTLLVVSLLGFVLVLASKSAILGRFATARGELIFGPLDAVEAWRDILFSLLHTIVIVSLILALLGWEWRTSRARASIVLWLIVVVAAIDLLAANRWLIRCAPNALLDEPSAVSRILADRVKTRGGGGMQRVYRAPITFVRDDWSRDSSANRLNESLTGDIQTLFTRLPWRSVESTRLSMVESEGSIANADFKAVLDGIRLGNGPPPADRLKMLRYLGTNYLLLPNHVAGTSAVLRENGWRHVTEIESEWSLWEAEQPAARAWLVHDVERLEPISTADRSLEQATRDVWMPRGKPRDLSRVAVVESANVTGWPFGDPAPSRGASVADSRCRITRDESQCVAVEVETATAGLLVLADLFTDDWYATIESGDESPAAATNVYRTNRIMRGLVVPPGRHRVTFRYEPKSFYWGAWISAASWALLLGWVSHMAAKTRWRIN